MYKRYSGEFLSGKNVRWKVDILQEAEVPFGKIGELRFPADNPLVIEWKHTEKEEAVCGSTATLTITSPGDRTYEDMYIIRPGDIRMDVFRNGSLYWSGTLDPEFYEEPYAYFNEYEVTFTFSDFGILDRYKYTLTGIRTLQELTEHALAKSGINYSALDQRYITTSLVSGNSPMTLAGLSVHSENFYDEDGEPDTLYETLEGILQPLGLRIMQRNGVVWVYDLNGLYTLAPGNEVEWSDTDQVMGTDKVANNARITFSPYAASGMLDKNVEYKDKYSEEMTNLENSVPSDGDYYSYYTDYLEPRKDDYWDYNLLSFTLFLSEKAEGIAYKKPGTRYFHIQPLQGATECDGVAYSFYTGGHGSLKSGYPQRRLLAPGSPDGTLLMRTVRIPIQSLSEQDQKKYWLRLSMEMLCDPRYNPFSEAGDGNESGNYNEWKRASFVMVPASVTIYDGSGNAVKYYSNNDIYNKGGVPISLYSTKGEWKEGEGKSGSCWLSWYNPEDRQNDTGVLGWKTNRHCVGVTNKSMYKSFVRASEGQYIPYPPLGGYLEICIYSGLEIYIWPKMSELIFQKPMDATKLFGYLRYLLYKAPKLQLVRNSVVYSGADSDDVEYNGVINKHAKEELSIDTVCGTMEDSVPSARGIYLSSGNGLQIKTLSRAGRTTQAEQLLIGTLYSQYASRKTKLTGTATLLNGALCCYTERGQAGKRFICLSDVQNVVSDESDMEIVELRPDEYRADGE